MARVEWTLTSSNGIMTIATTREIELSHGTKATITIQGSGRSRAAACVELENRLDILARRVRTEFRDLNLAVAALNG
jgi:hypothetical protein